jgi:hypothetical protein
MEYTSTSTLNDILVGLDVVIFNVVGVTVVFLLMYLYRMHAFIT